MPTLTQLNVKKWLRNQKKGRIKSKLKKEMQGRKNNNNQRKEITGEKKFIRY
jgi:hypothetical protein